MNDNLGIVLMLFFMALALLVISRGLGTLTNAVRNIPAPTAQEVPDAETT